MKGFHSLIDKDVEFYDKQGEYIQGRVTAVMLLMDGKREICVNGRIYDFDYISNIQILTEDAECIRTDAI